MKIDDVEASSIEVRRGGGAKLAAGGGGIVAIVIAVIVSLTGGGGGGGGTSGAVLEAILGQMTGQTAGRAPVADAGGTDGIVGGDRLEGQERFVGQLRTLLDEYWSTEAAEIGADHVEPGFVVFENPVQTRGCGVGRPEAGPFYCPADQRIYIDLGFYEKLEEHLGFEGEFALAYVMAHEYGHHIENLLGMLDGGRSAAESVKVELQADCYAGAWAGWIDDEGRIDASDFDDAIRAANAVGDDAIQGPNADRDTFTHGSSEQRETAFRTGFEGGPGACSYKR